MPNVYLKLRMHYRPIAGNQIDERTKNQATKLDDQTSLPCIARTTATNEISKIKFL